MSAEDCLKEGAVVGDLLVRLKHANEVGEHSLVVDLARQVKEVVTTTPCVAPQLKEKVTNEVKALENFASGRSESGVDQAVDLLRRDLGVHEIVAHHERTRAKLAPALPKLRTLGYRVTVNGVTELKFVPRREADEAFEAFTSLYPGQKVELVPIEDTRPYTFPPPKREVAKPGEEFFQPSPEDIARMQEKYAAKPFSGERKEEE